MNTEVYCGMSKELYRKSVGRRIREIRLKRGETMEEFGKLFTPPASRGLVSNWENNYNYPNEARLKQLSIIGNISVHDLLYSDILQDFTTEELQAEIERRKSPHGNADLEK